MNRFSRDENGSKVEMQLLVKVRNFVARFLFFSALGSDPNEPNDKLMSLGLAAVALAGSSSVRMDYLIGHLIADGLHCLSRCFIGNYILRKVT